MNLSEKKLNTDYSLLQIAYWVTSAVVFCFTTVFLQFRGYSNYEIGIVFALGNVIGFVIQPLIAGYVDLRYVEDGADNLCEVGVNADCGHVGHLGVLSLKLIYALGEVGYRTGRIGGAQRGEVDAVEKLLVNLGGGILGKIFINEVFHLSFHESVVGSNLRFINHFMVFVFYHSL